MMPTDTERREVARRLRKASGLTEFAEVLGFNWNDDSDWAWKDVADLVADLIEPSCDRDALLALAGELKDSVKYLNDWQRPFLNAREVRSMAQRIRESIGE